MRVHIGALLVTTAAVLAGSGCAGNGPFAGLSRRASPYEQYLDALRSAGLDQTALARDWARAGEQSLQRAVTTNVPFSETGYFPPDVPSATAYRLDLRRGRRLSVEVTFESAEPGRLFVDLFELSTDPTPRRVASLDPAAAELSYQVERDATYVLRVQPELLRGGRFTLVHRTLSSLTFPVSGVSASAVQSLFGAARDAGAREHEGVDVFAPRGTPVVAAVGGVARADTNTLGGNVVWLRGRDGLSYYYAHLDRWAAEGTLTVTPGDVLGYVGNTGNARTTAPHLHFGIYDAGAIDPLPFLEPDDPAPDVPDARLERLGTLARVGVPRAALRSGADRRAERMRQLDRSSVVRIIGIADQALRVALPDESVGYLDPDALASVAAPLRSNRLESGSIIRERPSDQSPVVEVLEVPRQVDVLGIFGGYELIRLPADRQGWVARRITS